MLAGPFLYLPDTPIFVHYVRDDALADWVRRTYAFDDPATTLIISAVIEGEVRSLALQFGWGSQKVARLDAMLGRAVVVPLDYPAVVEAYARIDAHCRRMGTPIGENDTWIAATAHATGARLLTTDRDFDVLTPTFLARDWIDPKAQR
jgi:tRNA(fMet)-specific endonuclease VapC